MENKSGYDTSIEAHEHAQPEVIPKHVGDRTFEEQLSDGHHNRPTNAALNNACTAATTTAHDDSKVPSQPKPDWKATIKCYSCHQTGHFARECPDRNKCRNCGRPGHLAAACTNCGICGRGGHETSVCLDLTPCLFCPNRFDMYDHKTRDCPNPRCAFCRRRGHHELVCMRRYHAEGWEYCPKHIYRFGLASSRKGEGETAGTNSSDKAAWDELRRRIAEMNALVDPSRWVKAWGRRRV